MYRGLASGRYEFRLRALDAAGNQGDPSEAWQFSVDDSLALPEVDTGTDGACAHGCPHPHHHPHPITPRTLLLFVDTIVKTWPARSKDDYLSSIHPSTFVFAPPRFPAFARVFVYQLRSPVGKRVLCCISHDPPSCTCRAPHPRPSLTHNACPARGPTRRRL